MQSKILFFATLRDKAGVRSTEMEIPEGTTVYQLKARLIEQFPHLDWQLMEHCLASVNQDYRADEDEIPAGAEVAFFPPVSGGSPGANTSRCWRQKSGDV